MRALIAVLAVVACVASVPLEATTILLVSRAGEFVLAADSMELVAPDMRRSEASCKLLSDGRVIVAAAGITGDGGRWHPASQALSTLQSATSIHDAAKEVSAYVTPSLSNVLNAYAHKVAYRERLSGPQPWSNDFGLHMLLLGTDDLGAVAVELRWDVQVIKLLAGVPASMTVLAREPRVHRPPKRGDEPKVLVLGRGDALRHEVSVNGLGDLTLARVIDLVTLEATTDPLNVGGPIDVVTTARGKLRWLQRKDNCVDQ